jgi:hypothetical protein
LGVDAAGVFAPDDVVGGGDGAVVVEVAGQGEMVATPFGDLDAEGAVDELRPDRYSANLVTC